MAKWILRGGTVIDGTGSPRFRGDVAIAGDRIAAVGGGRRKAAGAREIDVSGKIVAPGFIDVHTHDDRALFAAPDMAAKASQGVTTVDHRQLRHQPRAADPGAGAAAAARPDRRRGAITFIRALPIIWPRSTGRRPRSTPPAWSGIRRCGSARWPNWNGRRATTRSRAMAERLQEALDAGAIGMSTGLFYAPAFHAPPQEIETLAALLRPAGALYTTHMRDETEHVQDSLDESFHVGEAARVPVVISHHKVSGVGNFGRTAETLPKIEAAMRRQEVGLDAYPYIASSTVLRTTRIEEALKVLITWSKPHPEQAGRDLADIARDWGVDILEAAGRLQPAGAIYWMMDEADVRRVLAFRPDDDRLGRAAARHPSAPAAVGDVSARSRALLPRGRAVRAGNRGA